GEFEAGKYRCLICNKEFNSESGVKYHINSVHSQDWFVTNKKASKKFEKFLKNQPKQIPELHYTPLEPPMGPIWLDMDRKEAVPGPEHIDMHMINAVKIEETSEEIMEVKGRIKGETIGETEMVDGKQTDCFAFSSSGSSSEVEAGLHDRQREINQWNLKRPGLMEQHGDAAE
ncbi:hypothetical protein XENORESO_020462, partial [Xenotaenia resolanae]